MRRPSALGALLAGLLGATLVAGPLTAPATAAPRVPDPTTSTLRQLAAHTGMRVGTAVDTSALANDATYRAVVGAEFDTVTPENVMKWEVVEPEQMCQRLIDYGYAGGWPWQWNEYREPVQACLRAARPPREAER